MNPDQTQIALKDAICKAMHDLDLKHGTAPGAPAYGESPVCDEYADAIYTALTDHLSRMIPVLIDAALKDPVAAEKLTKTMCVPVLTAIEDEINDKHDAAPTPDAYRPGLRVAARMVRDLRRHAQEES